MTLRLSLTFAGLMNWIEGARAYQKLVLERTYAIMVEEAPNVERWMRLNATWEDSCMPEKEYLRCVPYRDDAKLVVGVIAFYDMNLYNERCPDQDPTFDFSRQRHEKKRLKKDRGDATDSEEATSAESSLLLPGEGISVFDEPFQDIYLRIVGEFF